MRILLAEDDGALRDTVAEVLRHNGHGVDAAADGKTADTALLAGSYDLVVLDVGLPQMDGFELLRRLRGRSDRTPVLILTARDEVENRVRGLDLGADDYLTKPFAVPELEARVRALLRRAADGVVMLANGPLRLDTSNRQVSFDQAPLALSVREVAILEALLQRVGQVVIKARLAQQLSHWESEIGSNAVEVYIHRLRKKLESTGITIRTIHGLGYLMEEFVERP